MDFDLDFGSKPDMRVSFSNLFFLVTIGELGNAPKFSKKLITMVLF